MFFSSHVVECTQWPTLYYTRWLLAVLTTCSVMVDPISIASTIINVAKMIKKVIDDKLEADSLCKEVRATSLPKTAVLFACACHHGLSMATACRAHVPVSTGEREGGIYAPCCRRFKW